MSVFEKSSKNIAQIVPENSSNLKFSYFCLISDLLIFWLVAVVFVQKFQNSKNILQQLFSFQMKFKTSKNLILSQQISFLLSNSQVIIILDVILQLFRR